MLLAIGAVLALSFQVSVGISVGDSGTRVHASREDGYDTTVHHPRRPVTPELLATAFKDSLARRLLLRARAARLQQDSALRSYDAKTYERLSVGMGIGALGRDHLLYRYETAGRVQWERGVGVWTDVTGMRQAVPFAGKGDLKTTISDVQRPPVPYYPGSESLWITSQTVRSHIDETQLIHPLADGAEAYYTYQTGDSLSFRLPNGTVIRLRELKIRPREPQWNLAVGSFWFDVASGQLVRAAYRLAVPVTVWDAAAADTSDKDNDPPPAWVKALVSPLEGQLSAVAIEYGLFEGRFWLPTVRSLDGSAQAMFMHIPFKIDQSFTYQSVNAPVSLPRIMVQGRPAQELSDPTLERIAQHMRDSVRAARRAARDSGVAYKPPPEPACDSATGTYLIQRYHYDGRIPVAERVPCDIAKLASSPDLPKSIYGPDDQLFDAKDLEDLKTQALSLAAQAPLDLRHPSMLPAPALTYGPSMMRYNRIEGFSLGLSADEQLGGGYDALGVARLGLADLEPNLELTVTRTNLTRSLHLGVYNHLVSAADWGNPLSFGSSFSALMFGRDEGFYYRATGAELGGMRDVPFGGATVAWRAFVEQQRTARVNTNFAVDGADFPPNLTAARGVYTGVAGHLTHEYGLDPYGLRVVTDARVEVATGDSTYGRAAVDMTASHGLGPLAGAVTLSGGSSVGQLPRQRWWYLGGTQTIRGQSPDTTQSGNAYWMTRFELGTDQVGMRPTIFGDLGWVGDRAKIADVGRPMSGVGAGLSFMDGLFRFDVARGIYPRKQYRVDLYLNSRF